MTCLGYNISQILILQKLILLSVKKDIIEIIKEVKRIMVNCQIRDLRDIKLKDYMLR